MRYLPYAVASFALIGASLLACSASTVPSGESAPSAEGGAGDDGSLPGKDGGAGGDGSTSDASSDGGSDASGSLYLTATIDGTPVTYAPLALHPGAMTNQEVIENDNLGTEWVYLFMDIHLPLSVGRVYECGTDGAVDLGATKNTGGPGTKYVANKLSPGSSCTITVTRWESKLIEGTFVGTVVPETGGGSSIPIANGAFRTNIP